MDKQSLEHLETCDTRLLQIFTIVDTFIPLRVTEGFRDKETQDRLYNEVDANGKRKTKVKWPDSKHNTIPSIAVDAVPLPVDYHDMRKLHYFAGFVMAVAALHGVTLRWGGDWDGDKILGEPSDDWDKPHFEIKE